MRRSRRAPTLTALAVLAAAVVLAACGSSSSSSSSSSGGGSGGSSAKLSLVAYSTPKSAYEALIPAFQSTTDGKGVSFSQSYGGSGEQSRAVTNGQHADVVNFSLEPDVERLVKAGMVSPTWNQNATHGFVTNSVVVFITRPGNPKHVTGWPDLLKAAQANDPDAFDMVSIWGLGFKAELGGSLAPGLWMHQGAQRVLQQSRPGVLFNDLNACNSYQNALAAAAQVKVPTTFVLGERDMMTPAKAGKTLAAATPNARTVVLPGAGHMMMVEAPDELLAALQ